MNVTRIGIDLAKQVFQIHGVDREGKVLMRKQVAWISLRHPGSTIEIGMTH